MAAGGEVRHFELTRVCVLDSSGYWRRHFLAGGYGISKSRVQLKRS
jgi:hypothetical protein